MLVDMAVLQRTLRIGWASNAGSAVYLEDRGVKLIATARHVVEGALVGDRIAIRHQSQWTYVEIAEIEHDERGHDLSIIIPVTHWGEGLPRSRLDGRVPIGFDVVFCGFPLGLEMNGMPSSNGWPTAYVKGGMLSGFYRLNDETIYVFDAMNNVGFSGGPIVWRRPADSTLHIAGIVSNYIWDSDLPVLEKDEYGKVQKSPSHFVRPNSGFMRGTPAFQVERLIDIVVAKYLAKNITQSPLQTPPAE